MKSESPIMSDSANSAPRSGSTVNNKSPTPGTPEWSVKDRHHGYLKPTQRYLSRRHTAMYAREGMTFLHYPMHPSFPPKTADESIGMDTPKKSKFPPGSSIRRGDILKVGDVVLQHGHAGEIKYIGPLPGSPQPEEIYFGLQFTLPVGNSDGTFSGIRLFNGIRNYAGIYKAKQCMYRGESAANYIQRPMTVTVTVTTTTTTTLSADTEKQAEEGQVEVTREVTEGHVGRDFAPDVNVTEAEAKLERERKFYIEYERLGRQLKHTTRNLSGKSGLYAVNTMLVNKPHIKPISRYPNYLPELKAERKMNHEIEENVAKIDKDTLMKLIGQQQSQPTAADKVPNKSSHRFHTKIGVFRNQKQKSVQENLTKLTKLEKGQMLSLFRSHIERENNDQAEQSKPDSAADLQDIVAQKETFSDIGTAVPELTFSDYLNEVWRKNLH